MKGMEQRNSSIEIYRSPEGNIELNVKIPFGLHKAKWQSCLAVTEL